MIEQKEQRKRNTNEQKNTKKLNVSNESLNNQEPQIARVITNEKKGKEKLKITFLGGVGEIGKNMTAFEYKDEIIILDAGLTFPDDDLPGVDIVVPDISSLFQIHFSL